MSTGKLRAMLPACLVALGRRALVAEAAGPIRAVIVTGGHGYDRKTFHKAYEGHDAKAWTNPGHRRLLAQGIRWAAGRLDEKDESATPEQAASRQPEKGPQ